MTVQQVSSDNTTVPFIRSGITYAKEAATIIQDAGRSIALAFATLMAKIPLSLPTTGTADAGNTGDGTVTAVALAAGVIREGIYVLECLLAGVNGRVAGAVTPGGGNTGNGTVTGFAIVTGETPEVGDFTLLCTDIDEGGTAAGSMAFTGTGNGTSSAVVPGTKAIAGDYIITCIDASVSGSEIFEVIDPNGDMLETLTVGVAYLNDHFGVTLTDGSTDFIVGDFWTLTMTISHGGRFKLTDPNGVTLLDDIDLPGTPGGTVAVESGGIEFTITDGSTDFALDDSFTMAIAVADGGKFKLTDPGGNILRNDLFMNAGAGVATTFIVPEAGMTFIITDGSIDFAPGDFFNITATAVNKWTAFEEDEVNGAQIPRGIYLGGSITAAAIVAADVVDNPILAGGACTIDENQLVIEGTATLDSVLVGGGTIRDALVIIGIFAEDTVDIDSYENA